MPTTNSYRRAALLVATFVGLGCGIPARPTWTEPTPGPFTTGPYILLGKPGEAFIAVKANLAAPPIAEWHSPPHEIDPDAEVHQVAFSPFAGLWVAHLTNLPIGPDIAYRVATTNATTALERFRVGVESGKSFRFAAFGDTRTNHSVHRAVIEGMAREEIDFVLHTGDMVERGGIDKQWDIFFQVERPVLVDTPIIPALGNHDRSRTGKFRHYFLHRLWTRNRRYFSFDWGNLRVVVIDVDLECRQGCTQYSFAARALEEGAARGMLMVMMTHYPPYSSGEHGSHLGIRKPITDLARTYGVELVVAGHDHDYERSKPIDGVTYVVSGSAGAPIRPVRPSSWTAEARTEPHYVLVDVESDRLILRAVNLRGDTFDTYVINPNPPQD